MAPQCINQILWNCNIATFWDQINAYILLIDILPYSINKYQHAFFYVMAIFPKLQIVTFSVTRVQLIRIRSLLWLSSGGLLKLNYKKCINTLNFTVISGISMQYFCFTFGMQVT